MDVEMEKLKFLGIYGILEESFKILHKWRKIFTQITFAFILPLSLSFFAHMKVSHYFFLAKITHNKLPSQHTQIIYYLLYNFTFLIITAVLSLLPTATIIYTVACIYTARDVSFKQVIKILPQVWKRLLITSLCFFLGFVAFNFVAVFVLVLLLMAFVLIYGPNSLSLLNNNNDTANGTRTLILFFFIVFYFLALWYLTMIWQLSSVVCILEESCGFKAMGKSKKLLEGKIWMVSKLCMLISLSFGSVQLLLYFLAFRLAATMPATVSWGILGMNLVLRFLIIFLVKPVVETVVYFVCKSHHHESMEKSTLLEPLPAYLFVDYVPVNGKEENIIVYHNKP